MAELSGPTAPVSGSIDRSERPGRVGLLLVLAGLLVGAAIGLSFVANEQAQSLIVWLLALLAMAGVFFLFALAIGAIQLSGQGARDDITKSIVDAAPEATTVVEEGGRLIYANEAYLRSPGATALEPPLGGAHLRRLAGGVGGDLPARPGRPRRAQPHRGNPHGAAAERHRERNSRGSGSLCGR